MKRVRGKLAPSFESKTGKRLLIFIVLVGLAYAFFREPAANQDVLKGLKADITKCSDQMKIAQRQGIVTNIRHEGKSTNVTVDETKWNSATHNLKVAIGLAAYCLDSPTSGIHSVYIWGLRDGQIKGSITNGNWFD